MKHLASPTTAAMLLCLVGACTLFLPWVSTVIFVVESRDPPSKASMFGRTLHGFELWHGYVVAFGFVGLFLFLVAAAPLQPVPWWHSAVLLLGSAAIIVVSLIGQQYRYEKVYDQGHPKQMVSDPTWQWGSYLPVGVALLVMLTAALEIRIAIATRRGTDEGPDSQNRA